MPGCCSLSAVYQSTCTNISTFLLTETDCWDIGCTVVTLATRTVWSYSSASTVNTILSVSFVVLYIVWLCTDVLCTISIDTNCELYRTIFFFGGAESVYKLFDERRSKKN